LGKERKNKFKLIIKNLKIMEKKSNLGLEIIYWGLLLMTLYVFHGALHWPGMGIVEFCLVPIGIALGIWQIIREKKAGEKMAVVILNFLTKLCLFTGLVFVEQHLPGGGAFMLFAFLLYFVSVAVSSCIAVYKERNEKLYILLLIAILSYSFGALFYNVYELQGLQ
jgi:hypothetical protein